MNPLVDTDGLSGFPKDNLRCDGKLLRASTRGELGAESELFSLSTELMEIFCKLCGASSANGNVAAEVSES